MRTPSLPANPKLKALLLVATIAISIAYSWLAARALEPRFELPVDVVKASVWVGDSTVSSLHEVHSARWRELARISNEVGTAATALRWFGGEGRALSPLELVVRGTSTERLVVTDTRIEISPDVLMSKGQLTKAILKSFLLQRGSIDVISSHLRLDVASDVLLAMSNGALDLEVPGKSTALHYELVHPWWTYVRSYRGVCDSDWRSVELLPLCKANDGGQPKVSPSSYRSLLGAILWNSFSAQPVSKRFAFARKWSNFLGRARSVGEGSGTREQLFAEVATLMPTDEFPEATIAIRASLSDARLLEPASIEADLLVRKETIEESDRAAIEVLMKNRPNLAVFARTKDGLVTFPGGIKVEARDLVVKKVKHEIQQTCEAPQLKDVAKREVPTTRLVWVKHCKEKDTALVYGPLLSIGMEGFARSNPGVTFIQYRPENVAFALRTGRTNPSWFGLAQATWIDSASAFRVHGAIEAVEWHRMAKAPGRADEPISTDF